MRARFGGVSALLVLLLPLSALVASSRAAAPTSVLDDVLLRLRRRNPHLEQTFFTQVFEVSEGSRYVAVAVARTRAPRRVEDEWFGIFLLDSLLTRVTDTVDLFATPRLLDYDLQIHFLSPDSIEVRGRGETYGDVPMTRRYSLPPKTGRHLIK